MSTKWPMPGILNNKHPGCVYKDCGIVPYGNRYMLIVNGEQVKLCNSVETAKKFIDRNVKVKGYK